MAGHWTLNPETQVRFLDEESIIFVWNKTI
jgi:hypothetical protein